MELIRKVLHILTKREKIQILILVVLMIIGASLETFGIGFIIPFIGMVNDPQVVLRNKNLHLIYQLLGMASFYEFLFLIGILLVFFYIFKNIYMFFVNFIQYKFIFGKQAALSARLFETYLRNPYVFFMQRNSADLLRNVDSDVNQFYSSVILQSLILFSELLVVSGICFLLFLKEPYLTLIATSILGVCSIIFRKVFHKKIDTISKKRHFIIGQRYKVLNQSFGAIKEIKVMKRESFFVNVFKEYCDSYSKVNYTFNLINIMPRIVFETITVVIILTIILIVLSKNSGTGNVISVLALFTAASFRLMPSATRINTALANIRNGKASIDELYKDLTQNKI